MNLFIFKNELIKVLAEELAAIHKTADLEYYKPHLKNYIPIPGKNETSGHLLNWAIPIDRLAKRLGIGREVYEEAYEIYDFRNSGKAGYTMRDGKIVSQID